MTYGISICQIYNSVLPPKSNNLSVVLTYNYIVFLNLLKHIQVCIVNLFFVYFQLFLYSKLRFASDSGTGTDMSCWHVSICFHVWIRTVNNNYSNCAHVLLSWKFCIVFLAHFSSFGLPVCSLANLHHPQSDRSYQISFPSFSVSASRNTFLFCHLLKIWAETPCLHHFLIRFSMLYRP